MLFEMQVTTVELIKSVVTLSDRYVHLLLKGEGEHEDENKIALHGVSIITHLSCVPALKVRAAPLHCKCFFLAANELSES